MRSMMTIALLAGALSAGAADAAEKLRIGYVDLRQVVVESKGGQQHKAEMEKAVKAKQEQISKEEEKLKALKDKFDKDQLAMSESQKQARQQELQEKFQALQKLANDAQGELRKKDMDYTNKSLGEVREIIGALAKEEDLALVFEKSELSVLYAEDGLDLTPKVLQKLDAKSARK